MSRTIAISGVVLTTDCPVTESFPSREEAPQVELVSSCADAFVRHMALKRRTKGSTRDMMNKEKKDYEWIVPARHRDCESVSKQTDIIKERSFLLLKSDSWQMYYAQRKSSASKPHSTDQKFTI